MHLNGSQQTTYPALQFCVSFSDLPGQDDPDYEDYYDDPFGDFSVRPGYMICYGELPTPEKSFSDIFYPFAIFISWFFILLTIILAIMINNVPSSNN